MKLFSEFTRVDADPMHAPETSFAFYDRAAGSYWEALREAFEEWFSRVPLVFQTDLRSRLMAKDRRQFEAAFWELYLHEAFTRSGFAVDFQPELHRPNKTPLTPDFLLEREGNFVYVEAVTVPESSKEMAEDSRRMELRESINRRVFDQNFYVEFEVKRLGSNTPPLARLALELRNWLGQLPPPDTVAALRAMYGMFDWPSWEWSDADWKLKFVAWPKDVMHRSYGPTPAIAIGPSFGRVSDALADGWAIRESLHGKASKYRDLSHPLVLAVLVRRPFCKDGDVQNALYGGLSREAIQGNGTVSGARGVDLDGLWASRLGPLDRHVSAVLSSVNLIPASVVAQVPTLWLGPWAARPVAPLFDFARVTVANPTGVFHTSSPKSTLSQTFGLPSDWPPGEPFPAARF